MARKKKQELELGQHEIVLRIELPVSWSPEDQEAESAMALELCSNPVGTTPVWMILTRRGDTEEGVSLDDATARSLILAASARLPMAGTFVEMTPEDAREKLAEENEIRCPDCHRKVEQCRTCGATE